jgi:hypothetical protein
VGGLPAMDEITNTVNKNIVDFVVRMSYRYVNGEITAEELANEIVLHLQKSARL